MTLFRSGVAEVGAVVEHTVTFTTQEVISPRYYPIFLIEVSVPEHAHGDQWGVVIAGRIELTIGDQTRTYSRGDTYFIPAGTSHRARIYPGFRAVDYFADRDRYRPRAPKTSSSSSSASSRVFGGGRSIPAKKR